MAETRSSASHKNIVIIGGSYGGISTAHYLLKHVVPQLPDTDTYEVILISTSSQAMCRLACPRALISDNMFKQEKLFVGIAKQFEQYPSHQFRFIHGTAEVLDHSNRSVTVNVANGNTEMVDFHALVIATGASTHSPLLGLNRDADFLRASWKEFREAIPTARSILIAGGGPAGVETAGELGGELNGRAWWFVDKLANPKVHITLATSESKILPALRPTIAKKAERYLAKVGVEIIKNARVKGVSPEGTGTDNGLIASKAEVMLEDGKILEADLYIPAFGTRPNTGFLDKSLLLPDGRIKMNASTLRVDQAGPRIYAVVDVGSYARPAIHLILNAIPVLCANVKRDLLWQLGRKQVRLKRIGRSLRIRGRRSWSPSRRVGALVQQWDMHCRVH